MPAADAPDILRAIVAAKEVEVERLKRAIPISELEGRAARQTPPLNMAGALTGSEIRIIAEIKKRSPAKGLLKADLDVGTQAASYADGGAAAISVLTNSDHFGGSIDDLAAAAEVAHSRALPVLRKEFIFDPYQVAEARAWGADAILLIVAMLLPHELAGLKELAERRWMQTIVEVHDEAELDVALDVGAEIIGINNRDLRTFVTDLATTERLASRIPAGRIVVSESGIGDREDLRRLAAAGAHAALIGESLVVSPDPAEMLRSLLK